MRHRACTRITCIRWDTSASISTNYSAPGIIRKDEPVDEDESRQPRAAGHTAVIALPEAVPSDGSEHQLCRRCRIRSSELSQGQFLFGMTPSPRFKDLVFY